MRKVCSARRKVEIEVTVISGIDLEPLPDIEIIHDHMYVSDGCPLVKCGILMDWLVKYVLKYNIYHDWRDVYRQQKIISALCRATSIGLDNAKWSMVSALSCPWESVTSLVCVDTNLLLLLTQNMCPHVKSLKVNMTNSPRFLWTEDRGLEKLRLAWTWMNIETNIFIDAQIVKRWIHTQKSLQMLEIYVDDVFDWIVEGELETDKELVSLEDNLQLEVRALFCMEAQVKLFLSKIFEDADKIPIHLELSDFTRELY